MSLWLIPSRCLTTPLREVPWATHSTVSLGEEVGGLQDPGCAEDSPLPDPGLDVLLPEGHSPGHQVLEGLGPGHGARGQGGHPGLGLDLEGQAGGAGGQGVGDLLVERVVVIHGCWGCGVGPPPDCHLGTGRHPWRGTGFC